VALTDRPEITISMIVGLCLRCAADSRADPRFGTHPIIDINPRRDQALKESYKRKRNAKAVELHLRRGCALSRTHNGGAGERRLKDEFGGGRFGSEAMPR